MTWIYAYPMWALALAAIVAFGGTSVGMAIAVHRVLRLRELRNNDVAGPIAGVVGTILAVLLSFMLVIAWSEYDQAAGTASGEAAAAADLYQLSAQLPPAARARLRDLLRQYAATVVGREWPMMRAGRESSSANALGYDLIRAATSYEPKSSAGQAVQSEALALAGTIVDSRRDRLFDNQQGIPLFFYAGIAVIVFATFVMCALFRVRKAHMHFIMAGAVGVVVAVVLVLIAEFDYPFRGDTQIPPTAWTSVLHVTQSSGR